MTSHDFADLVAAAGGITAAASLCGVSDRQLRAWLRHDNPPEPVRRLLHVTAGGDLGEIFGKAWETISISRFGVRLPGWKSPTPPEELRSVFYSVQLVGGLQREKNRATAELEVALRQAEAAEERAQWYRRQLRAESRLGFLVGLMSTE